MSARHQRNGRIRLPLNLVVCLLLSACVSTAQGPDPAGTGAIPAGNAGRENMRLVTDLPPPPATRDGRDVPVARNDLLSIDVFQVDELDKKVRVDANGRISLPLIGMVDAAGKTVHELASDIAREYGRKYLQDPQVTVFVEESAGQRVTVDGAVKKPGIYPITSGSTLLQAIAQAGGLDEIADETKLYVFRRFGEVKLVAAYDVKEIRSGKKPDPRIYGGDVLVAFPSKSKIAAENVRDVLLSVSRLGVFLQ